MTSATLLNLVVVPVLTPGRNELDISAMSMVGGWLLMRNDGMIIVRDVKSSIAIRRSRTRGILMGLWRVLLLRMR